MRMFGIIHILQIEAVFISLSTFDLHGVVILNRGYDCRQKLEEQEQIPKREEAH